MSKRPVNVWLMRDKRGIKLRVEVIPEVEDFFRMHGGGVEEGPSQGRLWKSLDGTPIKLWSLDMNNLDESMATSLMRTGCALRDRADGRGVINISFMRLVGASQSGGQVITIDGVMSTDEVDRIGAELIKQATRFYKDYIMPVNINCFVGIVDHSHLGPIQLNMEGERVR